LEVFVNPLYAPSLTLRAARDLYFAVNGFGADGGYAATWVDFKLGPIPMPFPNTAGRVRAVRFHDLHHILTGYPTTTLGEFEISAWELGAGCKDFHAAWVLNLSAVAAGLLVNPLSMLRAFTRGRGSASLYGHDFEALLDRTVGEVRAECGVDRPAEARLANLPLLVAAGAAGLVVGMGFMFPVMAVVGPALFIAARLRGKASSSPTLVDSAAPR
jgi:hypothetical protein